MFMGAMVGVGIFSVVASDASGHDTGAPQTGTVTASGSASVSNAIGAVSYSWELVSSTQGAAQSIMSGGSTATPTFRATGVAQGTPSISTWRVTATDAAGRSDIDTCTCTLTWSSTS